MNLRTYSRRPRPQYSTHRVAKLQALRVKTPEVLVIENKANSRLLMNPQHVSGAESHVVVLQHQPALHVRRQLLPGAHPSRSAVLSTAVRTSYVDHHHCLGTEFHQVEHLP